MPDKEQYGNTKSELLARIDVAMGGNVGEEMVFGVEKTTSGKYSPHFTISLLLYSILPW